ncbi:MAG: response regulator [Phycisphaerales bacterium]|nr:response regulator [Phycisphaerales bacterium]
MKVQQASAIESLDILVVDADGETSGIVQQADTSGARQLRTAANADQAIAQMKHKPADVLMVNLQINDNGGVSLIESLHQQYPDTQIIALSRAKKSDACLDAWRSGASDMLTAPFAPADVQRSLASLAAKRSRMDQLSRRNQRLRQVCKQLNKARHDISRQVDLLCNDLVRAYQDMAVQLNLTQISVDFAQAVGDEIEVEGILRKTMEWVLQKFGPINAAVYLADADHRFALGAYLNLDTRADADLINAIGDTIVRQADGSAHALAVQNDHTLAELFGEQARPLMGRAWLSVPCYTIASKSRECLAVLVLFRHPPNTADSPPQSNEGAFGESVRGMIEAIAPLLGEKIEQAIELYHRMHPEEDDLGEEEFHGP